MDFGIERAKIITLNIAHLHPETISILDQKKGDLEEGPSIAIRDEGFLVNSHLGMPDALEQDFQPGMFASLNHRFPDLVLIRALARSLGAEWINLDCDGIEYADVLPIYQSGDMQLPSEPFWTHEGTQLRVTGSGTPILEFHKDVLEALEHREAFATPISNTEF
jgi:hypothetical protein